MIHWMVLNLCILIWPLPSVDRVTAQCCFSKTHLYMALKEMVKDCLLLFENTPVWDSWWQRNRVREISSSHNSVAEDSDLQGCVAVTVSQPTNTFTHFKNCLYLPLTLKLHYCMHLPGITASPQPFWVKDQNTKGFVTGNYTRPCTASISKKMYCI